MKSNIKTIDNAAARKRLNLISITFGFNTLAGSIVFVLAFSGFGVSLTWIHLILCIVLMTLAEMISIPAATAATGSLAPQDRVGRYMGLHGLVQGIGWSLGPFLGSQLFDAYAARPVILWSMLSIPALMAGIGFLGIGFRKSAR